jgi:hypothetical protein
VNSHLEVQAPDDLRAVCASECVHTVDLPVSDDALRQLMTDVLGDASTSRTCLIASTHSSDFSWGLVNRMIRARPGEAGADDVRVVERGADVEDCAAVMWLLPSLLGDTERAVAVYRYTQTAVILVRRGRTLVGDVAAVAHLLETSGFTIRAVVLVADENSAWRTWRRFAQAYGVWSDPESPWPVIDVLEDEKVRNNPQRRPWFRRR